MKIINLLIGKLFQKEIEEIRNIYSGSISNAIDLLHVQMVNTDNIEKTMEFKQKSKDLRELLQKVQSDEIIEISLDEMYRFDFDSKVKKIIDGKNVIPENVGVIISEQGKKEEKKNELTIQIRPELNMDEMKKQIEKVLKSITSGSTSGIQ